MSKKPVNNPFGELNLRLNPGNANLPPSEDEPLRTLIVGNLGDRVGEEILYELFLQAGPLSGIRMPRDKTTQRPNGMAFVVFRHLGSVDFALRLMSGLRLYGRELVLTKMGAINPAPHTQAQIAPALPVLPAHQYSEGHSERGYQNSHNHYTSYAPGPRPPMLPPPPLFNKGLFNNYSPMPSFRPPLHIPYSDPGYSYGRGEFRRSHVYQGSYAEQPRNGSSSRQQSSCTPKRPLPYSKSSAQSKGNHWR